MTPTPESLETFRQQVAQVPFLQLVGIQLDELGDGTAEMSLVVEDKHLQMMGIAHGGVIATLLDAVTWWAAFSAQEEPYAQPLVSADLKLNYLSALRLGHVVARGQCKKSGRRLYYAVGEVRNGNGKLIADGASTILVQG